MRSLLLGSFRQSHLRGTQAIGFRQGKRRAPLFDWLGLAQNWKDAEDDGLFTSAKPQYADGVATRQRESEYFST